MSLDWRLPEPDRACPSAAPAAVITALETSFARGVFARMSPAPPDVRPQPAAVPLFRFRPTWLRRVAARADFTRPPSPIPTAVALDGP